MVGILSLSVKATGLNLFTAGTDILTVGETKIMKNGKKVKCKPRTDQPLSY